MPDPYFEKMISDIQAVRSQFQQRQAGFTPLRAIVKVVPLPYQEAFIVELIESMAGLGIKTVRVDYDAGSSPSSDGLFKMILERSDHSSPRKLLQRNVLRQILHRESAQIINEAYHKNNDVILLVWNHVKPFYQSFKVARQLRKWIYDTSSTWMVVSDSPFPALFMGLLNPNGSIDSTGDQFDEMITVEKEMDLITSEPPFNLTIFNQSGKFVGNAYEAYFCQNHLFMDEDGLDAEKPDFAIFLSDDGHYYIGISFKADWQVSIYEHKKIEFTFQKDSSLIIRWPDRDITIPYVEQISGLTLATRFKTVYCNPRVTSNPFFAFSMYGDDFMQLKMNRAGSATSSYLVLLK